MQLASYPKNLIIIDGLYLTQLLASRSRSEGKWVSINSVFLSLLESLYAQILRGALATRYFVTSDLTNTSDSALYRDLKDFGYILQISNKRDKKAF